MLRSITKLLLAISLLTLVQNNQLVHDYLKIFRQIISDSDSSSSSPSSSGLLSSSNRFLEQPLNLNNLDYFKFIPKYISSVQVDSSYQYKAECFQETTFTVSRNEQQQILIDIVLSDSASWTCTDFYLIAYHGQYKVVEYVLRGNKQIVFNKPTSAALDYDLNTNGIRILKFQSSMVTTLEQLTYSAGLFIPVAINAVPTIVAEANLNFLHSHLNITMDARPTQQLPIDPSEIQSGDFLGIIRLDGLDPMIAWGMGSMTGHTTVAQHIDNVLHICESQAAGAYWDVNGIQCTEYSEWLVKAKKADFNVVWAPLSQASRDIYDESKSLAFFQSVEGYDYGYMTLLTGWLDTLKDNLPCFPPDYNTCLAPELLDILFTIVESISPKASIIWKQAMGQRAGLTGDNYTITQAYYAAGLNNITNVQLYQEVEEDHFVYSTTRNGQKMDGPSMVCCVFVCRMWKAAGLFQNYTQDINCGEFTNPDVYKMDVFDKDFQRPANCITNDPENPLCQLTGKYKLRLDLGPGKESHYNRVPIHSHAAEQCPSLGPDYIQADSC